MCMSEGPLMTARPRFFLPCEKGTVLFFTPTHMLIILIDGAAGTGFGIICVSL